MTTTNATPTRFADLAVGDRFRLAEPGEDPRSLRVKDARSLWVKDDDFYARSGGRILRVLGRTLVTRED